MSEKMKMTLSDQALEQVVGGTDTNNGNMELKKKMVCPNPGCESHNPRSPIYDNNQAWFKLISGGRAYCEVCNYERNL